MTADEGWYVYLVECADGSLYTGIAKDVSRRVEEHNEGKGAKYTRGRGPVVLLGRDGPMTRPEALRRELAIKRLAPARKRASLPFD